MLFKLMRHDFGYSAKMFFGLGAIGIALAFILGGFDSLYQDERRMFGGMEQSIIFSPNSAFMQLAMLVLVPVAVAAAIHIGQFFRQSMFGKAGHLSMTMPVSRRILLMSKLVVSFVWVLYAIGVALVMVAITHIVSPYLHIGYFFTFIDVGTIAFAIHASILAFAAISLLFFCITLMHSVIAGKRISIVIAGIIGLASTGLYAIAANILGRRFTPTTQWPVTLNDGTIITHVSYHAPLTGLQYGRIPLGHRPWGGFEVYIDIFFIAFTLAVAVLVIIATRMLLKNHVSI